MHVSLQDIQRARAVQDPDLAKLCIALAQSNEPEQLAEAAPVAEAPAEPPEGDQPKSEKARETYFRMIETREFAALPAREQARFRVQQFRLIEADKKSPERYRLYPVLLELWQSNGLYERDCLKRIIAEAPLRHGVWKALKRIFKEAQDNQDSDMFGAIAARIDLEQASRRSHDEVRYGTLLYLARRTWRHLRDLGTHFSSVYCQNAVDLLKAYPTSTRWINTWVANHIFYHATGEYHAKGFKPKVQNKDRLRYRAFAELWQRSPQPLLRLLEEAQSPVVLSFAAESLKKDHAISLREISETTVLRLLKLRRPEIDAFCVWIFDSVPKFEHARLRELGLHEAIIGLLKSDSPEAQSFAATYVRSHAKDLPLEQVLELVNHNTQEIRELAVALLGERDPRKQIGLAAWTSLLGSYYGNALAEATILKHFSAKDLDLAWFRAALLAPMSFRFAAYQLLNFHKLESLGPEFFIELFEAPGCDRATANFVVEQLRRFAIEKLPLAFLQQALFNKLTSQELIGWVNSGYCDSKRFGVDWLLSLAYQPEWQANSRIQALIAADAAGGYRHYGPGFDEELSEVILGWLSDVRKFAPQEIGFDRLMQLVERKEARYHDFAARYMTKAFVPADFAPASAANATADASGPIKVDLQGQSFLFTGKLNTMTRSEAEKKLIEAKGKEGSGVSKTLDYLVIGDEGSPLYGAGKKGSKQLKAESLIAAGAAIKIISETAFLQMLSGQRREADADAVAAGSERLWQLATAKGDERAPLRLFALRYLRHHHQDIAPTLNDRPVDPGAEIPHAFFSFERIAPLFRESRANLLELGLELAHWEAASWHPPFQALFELLETAPLKVRQFLAEALLAGPDKAHDRYRLPADLLSANHVYRLCESPEPFARNLGMQLLAAHPELTDAASLFRLTESTDRQMRNFAVAAIWHHYRARGVSNNWTPPSAASTEPVPESPPAADKKASKNKKAATSTQAAKTQPTQKQPVTTESEKPQASPWLAEAQTMQDFLRRMLFEIPPGRDRTRRKEVKTLPSGKAKVALVETYRQLALSDQQFAEMASPILAEFMASRGLLEERACLVAISQIVAKYPELEPPGFAPLPASQLKAAQPKAVQAKESKPETYKGVQA